MIRTQVQWRQLIEDQIQSGMTAAEFCRKHNLDRKYFSLRKSQILKDVTSQAEPGFVRLPVPERIQDSRSGFAGIEIQVGAVKIRLPSQSLPLWVAELVKALA